MEPTRVGVDLKKNGVELEEDGSVITRAFQEGYSHHLCLRSAVGRKGGARVCRPVDQWTRPFTKSLAVKNTPPRWFGSSPWELARDWIDNIVSCHVIRTLTSHVSSKLDDLDASPWNMVSHRYPWSLYINRCCFTQRQIKAEATNGEREAGWDIQFHRS